VQSFSDRSLVDAQPPLAPLPVDVVGSTFETDPAASSSSNSGQAVIATENQVCLVTIQCSVHTGRDQLKARARYKL